ncbi:hypothetical protein DFJ43DRAFT_1159261 [Lentinula guzmanii]|uniref:Uncharacterized protein n=1 Tax=Lentinula guzmanii TaxID=2804957 RepID=A0AA38MWI0_9AGAR|nr:hypothetical protein DFJ43DRAFT_1159261 [Lentinula guzmanii]
MVAMDASDLFQLPHFSFSDEQPYLESDGEDQLLFTPIPDPAVQALYLTRDHLPEDVIYWEGSIVSGLCFRFRFLALHIERGGYACRLSPKFTVVGRPLELQRHSKLEAELKRIEKEDVESQRFRRRADFHRDFDLDSVSNTAQDFLGVTPTQICTDILPEYRVVHVGSINQLRKLVPPDQRHVGAGHEEEFCGVYCQTKTHGTRPDLVPSIVQHGFLKPGSTHPGTGIPLPVRNGSTYRRGIYSSPSSAFSLAFSGPQCQATKPGHRLETVDRVRDQIHTRRTTDGNTSCLIMRKSFLATSYTRIGQVTLRRIILCPTRKKGLGIHNSDSSPGDRQRLKENRLAQARKIFAYGFEPVSGTSIVIEDITDIEDDEEDYGECQTNRLDDVQKVVIWTYGLAEETDKDECTSQRKAHYGKSRSIKDEELSD